jgi:hypothetical protein
MEIVQKDFQIVTLGSIIRKINVLRIKLLTLFQQLATGYLCKSPCLLIVH